MSDLSTWKPTDGGAILRGALVGAAVGATAGAAIMVGGATIAGTTAGYAASTVLSNSALGAGEGLAQGWAAGDSGGDLFYDAAVGSATGIAGGLVGKGMGAIWEYGSRASGKAFARGSIMAGRVLENAIGSGFSNFTGQVLSGQDFDPFSLTISMVIGGISGHVQGPRRIARWREFAFDAFGGIANFGSQTIYGGLKNTYGASTDIHRPGRLGLQL